MVHVRVLYIIFAEKVVAYYRLLAGSIISKSRQ